MHPMLERARSATDTALAGATRRAARVDRHTLAWAGLVLAGVLLLAVNLIGGTALRSMKLDLTKDGLYTISDGTRKALSAIDEPIDVRVYFSRRLGEAAPAYGKNFERVRTLLEQYRALAGGKLRVAYFDPEPFSDAEDRAVAAGLRGIRLNQEGEQGYFGLSGSNSTDNEASIAFFAPDRERFIEYDVTKLIHSLASPKKRIVGLVSSLPLDGGLDPVMGMRGRPQPPQFVMEQIRESLEVKALEKDFKEIPADIDVLMVVQPDGLSPQAVYAIDQYALRGGKVLLFVDPVAEMSRQGGPMMMTGGPKLGDFEKVLKAWGVAFDPTKVAADIRHARRVQFGSGGQRGGTITEYVAWLGLDKKSLDQKDVLSGGIDRINVASAGILSKADGATTTVTPILRTSTEAMQIEADRVSIVPDAVGLLRGYKSGGKALMLAARVSGEAKSAYPEGAPRTEPKPEDKKGEDKKADAAKTGDKPATDGMTDATKAADAKADASKSAEPKTSDSRPATPAGPPHVGQGKVNVVVVADTDLLNDQFWVEIREFLGQQVAVPNAQNGAFVLGALENLTGSDALISLRGRGVTDRPFELVDSIRRDSEQRFREKELALTNRLKGVQEQLAKLEKAGEGEAVLLSDKDRAAIDKFRGELLSTRRELREVKLALRRDIDRLDAWLKFANIGLVPILIGAAGLGWTAWRRRRAAAKSS